MKNVNKALGVKNMSDPVLIDICICSTYKTKKLTKEQIKNIKWFKENFLKNIVI